MKTHPGSFWLGVAERFILLVCAWFIAAFAGLAWWSARSGELWLVLFDCALAVFFTVRWLGIYQRMLDNAAAADQ